MCWARLFPLAPTPFPPFPSSVQAVEVQKLAKADPRPHYLVRRYAEYFGALLGLNEEVHFPTVVDVLTRLRHEGEGGKRRRSVR